MCVCVCVCVCFVYFLTLRASWWPKAETHSVWTLLIIFTGLRLSPAIAVCYSANFAASPCPIQFKNSSFLTHNAMIVSLTGLLASTMVHFLGTAHIAIFFFKTWICLCNCNVLTAIYRTLQNTQKSFLTLYIICLCLFACFLVSFLFLISKLIHVYYRKYWKDRLSKRRK